MALVGNVKMENVYSVLLIPRVVLNVNKTGYLKREENLLYVFKPIVLKTVYVMKVCVQVVRKDLVK